MMKQIGYVKDMTLGVALLLLGGMGTAGAALQPVVNGQVYDDVLEISWLQDANFVKTSCDANNALWQAFDPTTIAGNSGRTKAQICSGGGRLNWNEAEAWIAVLNANNHLGHNDWRQWRVPNPTNDASCSDQDFDAAGSDRGFGCTGSELGNLFNATLGNPNDLDNSCAPNCLVDTGPFSNVQSFGYWSGTGYAPSPFSAWGFLTTNGEQRLFDTRNTVLYVWPVRPGQDVGAPTAVPTLSAWGLGLTGLLLAELARRRLR